MQKYNHETDCQLHKTSQTLSVFKSKLNTYPHSLTFPKLLSAK